MTAVFLIMVMVHHASSILLHMLSVPMICYWGMYLLPSIRTWGPLLLENPQGLSHSFLTLSDAKHAMLGITNGAWCHNTCTQLLTTQSCCSCRTACPLIRSGLAESFVWSKQWFCESTVEVLAAAMWMMYTYTYSVCLSNEVRRKQNNQWQWQPILISGGTHILRVTMTIAVTLRSSFAFRICQTIIRGLLSTGKVLC